MKIYLDTCCLNRPFDDRSQARVDLETSAVVAILEDVRAGGWSLVSSDAIDFEILTTPDENRRQEVDRLVELATIHQTESDEINNRAAALESAGFKPFDAMHLAMAEAAGCDYLCTCDDRFLKRCGKLSELTVQVVTPLRLLEQEGL